MCTELRARVAEASQGGDRDDLPVAIAERLARVEIAEGELDHHSRKVGGDLGDAACLEKPLQRSRRKVLNDIYATTITLTHHAISGGASLTPSSAARPSAAKTPATAADHPIRSNSWPTTA